MGTSLSPGEIRSSSLPRGRSAQTRRHHLAPFPPQILALETSRLSCRTLTPPANGTCVLAGKAATVSKRAMATSLSLNHWARHRISALWNQKPWWQSFSGPCCSKAICSAGSRCSPAPPIRVSASTRKAAVHFWSRNSCRGGNFAATT